MADNVKIIDGGGATSFIRAIGLAGGTYVMYSIPSKVDGTAYSAPATIALSMPVALPTDQIVSSLITNASITALISNANANGAATSAGSAPVVIANDQSGIASIISTKNLANGNSTTLLTPAFSTVSMNTLGTASIVAGNATTKIRVIALQLTNTTATAFKWQSAATDITGAANFTTNSGYVLPFNPVGWFETATGSALVGNSTASSAIGGSVTYVLI